MTKLNPCPECGNEPDIEPNGGYASVYCALCVEGFTITSASASGAMNAWNAATSDGTTTQSDKTLRDEFAMAALVIESVSGAYGDGDKAANAYKLADAMIKERNK